MALDLSELAISIVVLGIIVSIGAVILVNMRAANLPNVATNSIVNESILLSEAPATLSHVWVKDIGVMVNETGGDIITAANYTTAIDPNFGTATVTVTTAGSADLYNGSTTQLTYTIYNTTDPRYALPNSAAIGLGEYGNWFKIIVIVGVAAVILGLIFMAFNRGGGGSSMGSGDSGSAPVNY